MLGGLKRWANPVLFSWFVVIDIFTTAILFSPVDSFGGDAQIYNGAAAILLGGGDPWDAAIPIAFGPPNRIVAPPPSLVPYLATAWMPLPVALWIWVLVDLIAAVYTIWKLRLAPMWLAFPPLACSVWMGSLNPIGIALVVGGARWLGALLRPQLGTALLAERDWRGIAIVIGVTAVSLVLLPWGAFISHANEYPDVLVAQTWGGTSAARFLPLAVITALALIVMGWLRGWYLAVPALWPTNQMGYAVIALPVLRDLPLVAVAVAVPIVPFVGPLAIIASAVWFSSRFGRTLGPGEVMSGRVA